VTKPDPTSSAPPGRPAHWLARLLRDERGTEVLEYVLVTGLAVVAIIAIIAAVGGKVIARWSSVDAGIP